MDRSPRKGPHGRVLLVASDPVLTILYCPSQIKEWFVHVAGENKRIRPRFFIISKVCLLRQMRALNRLSGEIQQRDHPNIIQHEHAERRSEHLHQAVLPR